MLGRSPFARWFSEASIALAATVGVSATADGTVIKVAGLDAATFSFAALPVSPSKDAFVSSEFDFSSEASLQADYFSKGAAKVSFSVRPVETRIYRYAEGTTDALAVFSAVGDSDRKERFSPKPATFGLSGSASALGPIGNVFPHIIVNTVVAGNVIYEAYTDDARFTVNTTGDSSKFASGYANPATSAQFFAFAEAAVTRNGVKTVDASARSVFAVEAALSKKVVTFTYQDLRFDMGASGTGYTIFTDSLVADTAFKATGYTRVVRAKAGKVASFFAATAHISTVVIQPTVATSFEFLAVPADARRVANNTVDLLIDVAAEAKGEITKSLGARELSLTIDAQEVTPIVSETGAVDLFFGVVASGEGINKPKIIPDPKQAFLDVSASGRGAEAHFFKGEASVGMGGVAIGSINDLQRAPIWRTVELVEEFRDIILDTEDRAIDL